MYNFGSNWHNLKIYRFYYFNKQHILGCYGTQRHNSEEAVECLCRRRHDAWLAYLNCVWYTTQDEMPTEGISDMFCFLFNLFFCQLVGIEKALHEKPGTWTLWIMNVFCASTILHWRERQPLKLAWSVIYELMTLFHGRKQK